jgi:two-component system, NtrC family, response regulator AtoC
MLSQTHPPAGPSVHPEALQVLVYMRQQCTVFPLPETGTVRFGRGPSNDVRIDDPSVSRFHFALHVADSITVEDLGSSNGTSVFRGELDAVQEDPTHRDEGDARLIAGERRTLLPGDFIRAGVALIVVQAPLAEAAQRRASSHPPGDAGRLVLLDPAMRAAYDIAIRAAQSGLSVLISGETGAGKEVFAETIHQRSSRRDKPLLRLNCAALPESLLESELFGHERGAFTGATGVKVGLLESTDNGTIFLDEIGEMPLSTQAKLLRVLEEKKILRIGATKPRPIDVRFIWATNRDLRLEARLGRFRQDLYYRIAGVEFSIPPLRKRPSEIEPLARLFLGGACRRAGLAVPELTDEAIEALKAYSWPGNVRELRNVMERAPFLCAHGRILAEHIPRDEPQDHELFSADDQETTEVFMPSRPQRADAEAERARIARALEQCAGNQTRAAQLLGISRRTLINHLDRLDMPRPKKNG